MSEFAVIHIEIDDELTDVFEKLVSTKSNLLLLYIPARSLLLLSMLNLQLIAKKAKQQDKQLILITKDKIGRVLARKSGLHAVRDDRELTELMKNEFGHEYHGLSAEIDEQTEKKRSMFHSLWQAVVRALGIDEETEPQGRYKLSLIYTYKKAFVSILVFSVMILFAVTFFALPDATIIIEPKLANIPVSSNVTLSLQPTNLAEKMVQMIPVTVEYRTEIDYPATGKTFLGTNAMGTVTIFNMSREDKSIVANSRLQTEAGLVFLTKRFVTVPRARNGQAGTVTVEVEAREKDEQGEYIGEKGNIPPSQLSFPALSRENQRLVYAESTEAFTGGSTKIEYNVTQQDIDAANRNIVIDLENQAADELVKKVQEEHNKGDALYDVFEVQDKRFVKRELLGVDIPAGLVGQKMERFKVSGTMRAQGYYYNKSDMVAILKSHLQKNKLTFAEELIGMDVKTLKYPAIFPPKDEVIKVTAAMDGQVRYNFEKDNETLVAEIRDMVAGLDRDVALAALQSKPEIDGVQINLSPMWQKTLPPLRENIKVEIVARE